MAWQITIDDAHAIAIGAGILGTGGGGNTYLGKLQLLRYLKEGRTVTVIDPGDLRDDQMGVGIGGMGAPTVNYEKLPAGTEMTGAVRAIERHLGRPLDFVIAGEIGGANGIMPLVVAALTGHPVVDADPMGRAFPELQMDTFMINGVSPSPFSLCDAHGNTMVFHHVVSPLWAERIARAATIAMGGSAALGMPTLTGRQVKEFGIHGTLSLCKRLGQAVLEAQAQHLPPVPAILGEVPGVHLMNGKITDVSRQTTQGFARGELRVDGTGEWTGRLLEIGFQNEFLFARLDGEVVTTTPDLICIVDAETGDPISTEMLRYGLRIAVLGVAAPKELKTEQALRVVGPEAFGYGVPFRPLPGNLL